MTHTPKPKSAGSMELLFAAIVEGILEAIKAIKKLDARVKKLERWK